MQPEENYKEINRKSWNSRTAVHLESDFYDVAGFLQGKTSLKETELALLGDLQGKKVLHLQCHFGQDTISLARMGAVVTGADLSDVAIQKAKELAEKAGVEATFVCCDIYNLPQQLSGQFDIVFTSYGTIGWLPDLDSWAKVIAHFLRPKGEFILVEFHPVVWMFDDDFDKIKYPYFKGEAIVENSENTYANTEKKLCFQSVSWNHSMGEVVNNLLGNGLAIQSLNEYDYSPYNCFAHTEEFEKGKFRIKHLGNKIPMLYAVKACLI